MDQNCHANVFLLSCNIMDRFLSQLAIKKSQFQVRKRKRKNLPDQFKTTVLSSHTPLLQLVAAATMFIASKLADPCPITGTELVRYTNDTYNLTELLVSDTCMRNIISVGGFGASLGIPGYARDAQATPACCHRSD